MLELVLYDISTLWGLLASFFILLFTIGVGIYLYTKSFEMKDGKIKIYGLLLSMTRRDILIISTLIVRAFLIIYALIVSNGNVWLYIFMIGFVSAVFIVIYFKNMIYELINSIALMVIVYFSYELKFYLLNIEDSIATQIIRLILVSFGSIYTVYLFLREFEDITLEHENINE